MTDNTRELIADRAFYAVPSVSTEESWRIADAVLAALHPEITTAEELDALPTNSVVIDAGRWIHERWERAVPDDHGWVRVGWAFNEPADPPNLPARVLHRPDTEESR
ncbi:hypothetical protein [Prescottella equi]|uniref:Uncharacterized protein n=1 Tax=Rhodococcus phage REQ3 TaxID=1109714 RepID=G9FH68_9CAUD|nr:hypothetical protein [Prescottella equi]YP_005087213.1 hypothetical protein RoPhREQ3_gp21 [Rhodococcus phage REQ3]AEV51957.1 hypothetical protein [Rhodococcus phage REQ3]ERN43268.1 hypothetical protein H849_24404 [Prescottella equi NBRC 101255 = C 7]ORL29049.1 hypothetical protein A6I89_01835 [Prescottella equi]QPQ77284.1 hypothetical protein I6H09_00125 [Prescottella equi]SUE04863.1 Uncharacterised protein [Prescottella equi]